MKKDIIIIILSGILFVALFTALPHFFGVVVFAHTMAFLTLSGFVWFLIYSIKEEKRQEEREKEFYRWLNK